ncbi:patatin-like phospholipase family protein [Arcanobacterium bovis]|uniref:patatin-like phospholipase family protein n=1 Tax=Arcanobacterium bovis TaxID=2529275 RepID=UPI0013F1635C|nr:patatin-like phospholipase family protein [Arcanobacterium bovis]
MESKKTTCLHLEGGGSRCFFTLGVLSVFENNGLVFPTVYGVSAGAVCACLYQARQIRRTIERIDDLPQEVSRCISTGLDISDLTAFFPWMARVLHIDMEFGVEGDSSADVPSKIYSGLTSEYGEYTWIGLNQDQTWAEYVPVVAASCSMPGTSEEVDINGVRYMDGAVYEGFSLDVAEAHGYSRHVAVFTRPRDVWLTEGDIPREWTKGVQALPQVAKALRGRVERYNATKRRYLQLEERGEAVLIFPPEPLQVGVLEYRSDRLRELVEMGIEQGKQALKHMQKDSFSCA